MSLNPRKMDKLIEKFSFDILPEIIVCSLERLLNDMPTIDRYK